MAKPIETLSIQLKFKDAGSQAVIEKLRGSLKRLEVGASGAKPRIASLRKEILAQGNASVKSVSNINAQITALRGLRDEAKIGGRAFQQLTKDIDGLNAQLGKTQARGGMGARRATQAAGAVISGGIFGGPEGALGALGGLATGGVEGAYAGAAIGAAVGGARQALGETAAYAAEVNKLKIALEGVTGPGKNFESALSAAADATRDLNVPQQVAVKGITRLAAAVVGANGPVSDAELTFKNVTAAIKATGGNSQDVQGAITAMVQVFSKGKVSAEELSGQLGERLPGAVTMFAKANKMTLPELQKNLKAGTVGLNELMNFIVELGNEFDGTARRIASSNEEAGARLQVAFNEMRLGVGQALMGTGADLQNAFTQFVQKITPSVINATKEIVKNIDLVVAALGTFAAVVGGAKLIGAIKLLTATLAANPLFAGAAIAAGVVTGIVAINNALNGTARELDAIAKAGAKADATGAEKALAISTLKKQIADQKAIIDKGKVGQGGRGRVELATRRKAALEASLKEVTRVRTRPSTQPERDGFRYPDVTPDPSGSRQKDITKAKADALIAQLNIRKEDIFGQEKQIRLAADLARKAAEVLPEQRQRVELANIEKRERKQLLELEKKMQKIFSVKIISQLFLQSQLLLMELLQ